MTYLAAIGGFPTGTSNTPGDVATERRPIGVGRLESCPSIHCPTGHGSDRNLFGWTHNCSRPFRVAWRKLDIFLSNFTMAPPRTALLVIDMQRIFEPMTTAALPHIKTLVSRFQAASAPIIFTQHGHSEEELTTVPSPSQLVRRWGPAGSIAYGSDDWELQDAMRAYLEPASPGHRPRVVHKNTYDAFVNTDLARVLERAGIRRTVVCGVMTDCCWWVSPRGCCPRLSPGGCFQSQAAANVLGCCSVTRRQEVRSTVGSRRGSSVTHAAVRMRRSTRLV